MRNLQPWGAVLALHLRSVCWFTTAFHGLRCHPLTCMLLNVRLSADSIPSALTIFRINNLDKIPTKFSNLPHSPLPLSSSLSLVFSMTYIRRRATDAQSVVRFRIWEDLLIIQQHAILPNALWLKCGCVVMLFILFYALRMTRLPPMRRARV